MRRRRVILFLLAVVASVLLSFAAAWGPSWLRHQLAVSAGGGTANSAPTFPSLPATTTLPPPVLTPAGTPVILIYRDTSAVNNPYATRGKQVMTAVWGDGRVVWRKNGALLESRIDPAKIDTLLQRLHNTGVFGNGDASISSYGPDSAFDVVEVTLPDRQLRMASWHEAYEQNSGVVGTSKGLEALSGRDRNAVLAAEPPQYQRFRRIWSDIRSTVDSWLPAEGLQFTGSIAVGDASTYSNSATATPQAPTTAPADDEPLHIFNDRRDAIYEWVYIVRGNTVLAQRHVFPGYSDPQRFLVQTLNAKIAARLAPLLTAPGDLKPPFQPHSPNLMRTDRGQAGRLRLTAFFSNENKAVAGALTDLQMAVTSDGTRETDLPDWVKRDPELLREFEPGE